MKNKQDQIAAVLNKDMTVIIVSGDDRSKDRIIISSGTSKTEIPAVVFNYQETEKLYQLIAEG